MVTPTRSVMPQLFSYDDTLHKIKHMELQNHIYKQVWWCSYILQSKYKCVLKNQVKVMWETTLMIKPPQIIHNSQA